MLIWWLSQAECEAIGEFLPASVFPAAVRTEYCSRFGRAGRGRLWIPRGFGPVDVSDKFNTNNPLITHLEERGGIVIDDDLYDEVKDRPGLVTNLDLQLVAVPLGHELIPVKSRWERLADGKDLL